jgi:hypothetical protein
MTMDLDTRRSLSALKREIKALTGPARDEQRKARKAARERRKAALVRTPEQRQPRVRDSGYLHWLHEDLPCIACLIEGAAPAEHAFIEAAHQKHVDKRGPSLGVRPSDSASCPLCAWHHRLGPQCCDPAQRKFWDRLGVDVSAFCRDLFDAFRSGQEGVYVVRTHVLRRKLNGTVEVRS